MRTYHMKKIGQIQSLWYNKHFYIKQDIPYEILKEIFVESLVEKNQTGIATNYWNQDMAYKKGVIKDGYVEKFEVGGEIKCKKIL